MFYDIKYNEWREELLFKLKIRIENVDIIKWFFFFNLMKRGNKLSLKVLMFEYYLLVNL